MTETNLSNLIAWSVQAGALCVGAAVLSRLVPVDAPGVRYMWWRVVLLICLALPAVQPWQTRVVESIDLPSAEAVAPLPTSSTPASSAAAAGPRALAPAARPVATFVAAGLAAGILARLGYLAVGLIGLRRLRRTGRTADTSGAPDELAALTALGADVRYVASLRQPVTFGIRRAVVLLPETLQSTPAAVQRAVVTHELWHVRRRDWVWTVSEEALRAIFWFHPAIWHLISRIQAAREEVVDELSILATSARRSYLEALLAFADEPAVYPAAPFIKRRQLFNRMLLISREAVMSPRRIVVSITGMTGALVMVGWYSVGAFPLTQVEAATPAQQATGQARDPRPGVARPETAREQALRIALTTDPTIVSNWLELARLQEERGAGDLAAETFTSARRATNGHREVLMSMARFFTRTGDFDKAMATLEEAAAANPTDPSGHQLVAVYYWEKAQKDQRLSAADKARYIEAGIAATDRALAQRADYVEALTYKNILLRMQANAETDPTRRDALLAEANALRGRAMELAKLRTASGAPSAGVTGAPAPPPPPPPPPRPEWYNGQQPVRVGGGIKTPTKIRDVRPIYPPEALAARASGMVILEALVDAQGNVAEARVLRSIPLFDEAAKAAVMQWQFTPTLLNGVPVPVLMTVTVNFTVE